MSDKFPDTVESRSEDILRATIDKASYEIPPQSRMEELLIELKEVIEASQNYSLDEKKIGTWIDGSDLYQRTFVVTDGITVGDAWNNDILGTAGTGISIKEFSGLIQMRHAQSGTYPTYPLSYYKVEYRGTVYICEALGEDVINMTVNFYSGFGLTFNKAVITIKYTKTVAEEALL